MTPHPPDKVLDELAEKYGKSQYCASIEQDSAAHDFKAGYRARDEEVAKLRTAIEYCSIDDDMAVDPSGNFDAGSANEWKKMKSREALK